MPDPEPPVYVPTPTPTRPAEGPLGDGAQALPRNHLVPLLRGMSHAAGAALVQPAENAVFRAAAATAAPTASPLTLRQVRDAWDMNRREGLSVAWLSALQGALGVPVTGTSTNELVDAIARVQGAHENTKDLGVLKSTTRSFLVGVFPELADVPQRPVAAHLREGGACGNLEAPENDAVRLLGVAPTYVAYAASLKAMNFLGRNVVGHPEFLARLHNAVTYLRGKFPGKSADEIGEQMGVVELSSFRSSKRLKDQMYHGLGFALDVNPPQNNWLFSHGARGIKLGDTMKHVGDLFGQATVRGAADMSRAAKAGTTEEAFAALDASNEALKRYRTFKTDRAALEAHLASEAAPEAAKAKGAARWMQTIADDEKWLRENLHANPGDSGPAGFMDFQRELVIALRDAGGLRWGGADLGGDNGDLMHFDGGTMATAQRLRNATKEVQVQRAAEAATDEAP